ncbi:hypothetical protein [Oscillibacter sp.]|uniref:hypothetical protein n=1 Tax=Oscillibacter sp. TaxID=1945593 RepID=UPI0037C56D54
MPVGKRIFIACGNVSINPGDIIPGDPDGVVTIPRKDAAKVLENAKVFQAADVVTLEAAKNGTAKRGSVDKLLEDKEFEIMDDIYHVKR